MQILSLRAALVSGTAMLALTGTSFAQEDTQELNTVQVWGTSVQSSLLTLDESEISLRQADHLSDLLRIVPGVDIGGTHSVNSRINIRGLDDRQLDVYIDGALQTNFLYHHLGNLLVNADILTAADIEVGANSLTHGGVGGAVRFRTRSAQDMLAGSDQRFGGRIMGSYASNAQQSYSLTGYGQITDQIDALAYFHQVDRDNFQDGSGRDTIGSDGTTEDLLLKFGFEPTDNQRIQLSYDRLEDSGDYTQRPDMGVLTNSAITGDLTLPTDYVRETVNLNYSLDLGPTFRFEGAAYMNDLQLTRDETDPAVRTRSGNTLKRASADNQGINLLATSDLTLIGLEHSFQYGVQYFDQNLTFDPDLATNGATVDQSAQDLAVFIEDDISVTDRIGLRPGLRFVNYDVSYETSGSSGSFDDVLFALAADYEPVSGLQLLASYTEIFSGPELAEAFAGSGATKIVNPDLEPETGYNIEAGFRFQQPLAGGEFSLGANLFRTRLEDYISEVDVPGSTTGETMDDNLGVMEIEGFEASATYSNGAWNLFLTHNVSDFDSSGLNTTSLSDSFREVGGTTSYEISHAFGDGSVYLAVSGQFVAEETTSLGAEKESYNVHNIVARWQDAFGIEGLSLTGGIDNMFDRTYTSHASRTGETVHPVFGPLVLNDVEPGRNVKFTIAHVF